MKKWWRHTETFPSGLPSIHLFKMTTFLNCLCLGIKCCYPQHKLSLFLVGYDATITVCNKEFSGVKDETCVCLCCLLPIKAPSMVVVLAILVYLQCVSMGVSSISSQKSRPPEVLAPLCLRSHV